MKTIEFSDLPNKTSNTPLTVKEETSDGKPRFVRYTPHPLSKQADGTSR